MRSPDADTLPMPHSSAPPLAALAPRGALRAAADDGLGAWGRRGRTLLRVQPDHLAQPDPRWRGIFLRDGDHRAARPGGGDATRTVVLPQRPLRDLHRAPIAD